MHATLTRIKKAIEDATAGTERAALEFHPPKKWSITEILDHLSTTYAGTARLLARCLQEGPKPATPTRKQRIAKMVVFDIGYFPSGRNAPEFALPRGVAADAIVREICANLEAMDRQLATCEERFGRSTRVGEHFIFGPLTVQEWRTFHLRHAMHHMKQIVALRAMRARAAR